MHPQGSGADWGASFRLAAAQKWRSQSAAMGRAATEALLKLAHVLPGMRVLDLGCGTGEPAISLATQVGPQGQVVALDLNAELLLVAADRAAEGGLTNVVFHKGDAQALALPDRSFDVVTSRFGVMFFADIDKALRQAHRVLKPGGHVALLAWGPFEQPYFSSTAGVVLKHVAGPMFAPGAPNPFRFARPASLSTALKQAGFQRVREETRNVSWSWPGTPEQAWEYFQEVSAPFRPLLDRIPPGKQQQVAAEVQAAIRRYWDGKQVNFGALVVLASAAR